MDSWTEKQIRLMKIGGNQRCNEFLQKHGVKTVIATPSDDRNTIIRQKFDTPAAELYKQVLQAEIENRPVPTELPKKRPRAKPNLNRKMEGFGSGPPPSERENRGMDAKKVAMVAIPAVAALAAAAVWALAPH